MYYLIMSVLFLSMYYLIMAVLVFDVLPDYVLSLLGPSSMYYLIMSVLVRPFRCIT